MRPSPSFPDIRVSSLRLRMQRALGLTFAIMPLSPALALLLAMPRACITTIIDPSAPPVNANVNDAGAGDAGDTDRHHPQGRSLRALRAPGELQEFADPAPLDRGPWLQGQRLRATLADGRRVTIADFADGKVHVHPRNQNSQSRKMDNPHEPDAEQSQSIHPTRLAGMQWRESHCANDNCTTREFRVAEVRRDTSRNTTVTHGDNGDVWLYRVETATNIPEQPWQPVCSASSGHDDMGLFVNGQWDAAGTWRDDGYTFSCARGAISKCVRTWGYKPWLLTDRSAAPKAGENDVGANDAGDNNAVAGETTNNASEAGTVDQRHPLHTLHLACVRAVRADYCGDGVPYTRDGERIGLSDRYGFNAPPPAGADVEAAFDEAGAVSISRARVPELVPDCGAQPAPTTDAAALLKVWR